MRDAGGTCTSLGFRAQVPVASLSFSFDASLFRSPFCVACHPRHVHFVRSNDLRRGACRRGDVLFGRKSLFAAFLLDCRPSCMTTHQCVTFLVVTVKPQQSPVSQICHHFGTRSGGGIKSVVLHASSVGLGFVCPRARWGDMLRSPPAMSTKFSSAISLN